jgi:hypothetical protein
MRHTMPDDLKKSSLGRRIAQLLNHAGGVKVTRKIDYRNHPFSIRFYVPG